jgi:D-tyrosyl-tRNA(Tyr) deacylase
LKALLQRVSEASVSVAGHEISRIGPGLLVLLGVVAHDDRAAAARLADKTLGLRIFRDAAKPMNRSVVDVEGEILVVSQFTLAADTSRGRRPSFVAAAPPTEAEALYEHYVAQLAKGCGTVRTGQFGADMQVRLVNDGPVTILLEHPEQG